LSSSLPHFESNELLPKEFGSGITLILKWRGGKKIKSKTSNRVPVEIHQRHLAVKFPTTGLKARPSGSQLITQTNQLIKLNSLQDYNDPFHADVLF